MEFDLHQWSLNLINQGIPIIPIKDYAIITVFMKTFITADIGGTQIRTAGFPEVGIAPIK
jgi:hypothetical protein